jgi:NAD(P)-dependent dehydrogenase (short-subunit alcohol dehydrogenase family)
MQPADAVVLITGASSGIGRAAAAAFDHAGARVALAARRRERLEADAARMRNALAVPTDLADAAQAAAMVEKTAAHFGRLDVLINNAGASYVSRSDAIDPAALRRVLDANLVGAVVATGRAVAHMRRSGGGHVINVCSPAGWLGSPLLAVYAASKAAVAGWTRTLQGEWAGSEIRVSEFVPGLIETGLGAAAEAAPELGGRTADLLDDPPRGWLARAVSKPLAPEVVGEQLVDLVRRPRPVAYSSFAIRLVMALAQSPRLRRLMGIATREAFRRRLGTSLFSE